MNFNLNCRYILYARKSSESEDRQMASIGDQIAVMQKFASDHNLIIHDVIQEAKSAKAPGQRAGFQELIHRIQGGEADGILAWKLNRLARNPVDGGQISWLLQKGVIKHIQTHNRDYKPTDNVLMMQVEFGFANQFVNDLSVDVKRGMARKAERGWFPSTHLPIGYMHNSKFKFGVEDEIIPDPKRFKLMRNLWKMLLSGKYSVLQLKSEAEILGLTNFYGRPLVASSLYRSFNNTFYYGEFEWKDEHGIPITIKGKHKPMISKQDFLLAQTILGNRGRTISAPKYDFPFRGIFQCGECACSITVEEKVRAICTVCKHKYSIKTQTSCRRCGTDLQEMENPVIYKNTYYRCTKKRGPCSQACVNAKDLEQQILEKIQSISLPSDLVEFLKKIVLEESIESDEFADMVNPKDVNKEIGELRKRKDRLTELRVDGELNREEFLKRSEEITEKINALEEQLSLIDQANNLWEKEAINALDIAQTAFEIFKNGGNAEKRDILNGLGSNPTILDKKLDFSTPNLLLGFRSMVEEAIPEIRRFEPPKTCQPSPYFDKITLSKGQYSDLCAELKKVRTRWFKGISLKQTHKMAA